MNIKLLQILYKVLSLYLIEMPFNAFANRADPDQAVIVWSAWSGSNLFAHWNMIRYDPDK